VLNLEYSLTTSATYVPVNRTVLVAVEKEKKSVFFENLRHGDTLQEKLSKHRPGASRTSKDKAPPARRPSLKRGRYRRLDAADGSAPRSVVVSQLSDQEITAQGFVHQPMLVCDPSRPVAG